MTELDIGALRDDIELARRSPEMARHFTLDHGPAILDELERLRAREAEQTAQQPETYTAALSRPDDDGRYPAGWSNKTFVAFGEPALQLLGGPTYYLTVPIAKQMIVALAAVVTEIESRA